MILCLKTNTPEAELYLYDDNRHCLANIKWQAHKQLAETLHTTIENQLEAVGRTFADITGIVVYNGDGSFTGLRIAISVANALGYSLDVPVVDGFGQSWLTDGLQKLQSVDTRQYVIPEYSSPVFVTAQKK